MGVRLFARPAESHPGRTAVCLAVGLWIAVALATAGRTLVSPQRHTVFPIFAASVEHWWADQSLYADYRPLDAFRYPPAFPVLLTPCAALGLCAGGILWTWLGMAVYGAGLWRFARDVLPATWGLRRQALFLALGVVGGLRGLWNAQSNALVVGMLLLAAAGLVRARWWPAAAWLAAAVWVKLTPLAPALLLCALWPRRLAPRFAAALAAGALVPFFTRPPDVVLGHYADWFGHLFESGAVRWPGFRDGWTVWLVVQYLLEGASGPFPLLHPLDSRAYRVLQLLTAAGALAWCLWQQRRGASPRWLVQATLGMGVAWLMLFGPAIEHATYVFLAPSLLAALLDQEATSRSRPLIAAAGVLILVLGWGSLTRPLLPITPLPLLFLPLGCALFAVYLLAQPPDTLRIAETEPLVGPAPTSRPPAPSRRARQQRFPEPEPLATASAP